MPELYVLQSYGIGNFLCHAHFLADTIHEQELALRIPNGKRNARETASASHINYRSALFPSAKFLFDKAGNGKQAA